VTPRLCFYNHQETRPAPLKLWEGVALRALPLCLAARKTPDCDLGTLEEIEVSFVSDEEISRVHADFLDDPTPTDVITFPHGEIIISLDTAARQATDHSETYERETALYIIHALLHLAGWDDHEEKEREEMHALQSHILEQVWQAGV
jgi:probable rRNA maturation factor